MADKSIGCGSAAGKKRAKRGSSKKMANKQVESREFADEPAQLVVRRALVECHARLREILGRRLGNTEEAEEVLQAFTVRALERAGDLREMDSARAWLGRVLATAVADHFRRMGRSRAREKPTDPEILANLTPTVDAELDESACACLYRLLPTLRPMYADVLWRADLLDEPREQIALALGTSVSNVTLRLHRARRELRQRLLETCWSCPIHGFHNCQCLDRPDS
jgi:RNA polymerase sigma factor (sigma-70 family)